MNISLVIADLFCMGSIFGWFLELFYRKFISKANPQRKWINPGFCIGPWIPLYGCGLAILFIMSYVGSMYGMDDTIGKKIIMFILMAIVLTAIEYLAGILSIKLLNIRLWDYRKEKFNIKGIICPKFTFYWGVLSALYYFLVQPRTLAALQWLAENLAYSFFIGMFFGIFVVDAAYSSGLAIKISRFAKENDIIIIQEHFKARLHERRDKMEEKTRFFFLHLGEMPLVEHLRQEYEEFEDHITNEKKDRIEAIYRAKMKMRSKDVER